MKKTRTFLIVASLFAILVSACGPVSVEPPEFEIVNSITGEGIPPGKDAGGTTDLMTDMPNEKAIREFTACHMSAIHSNMVSQEANVTFHETGVTKPAKVYDCGTGDVGSGVLLSTILLVGLPVETTVLGVVIVIGVGIYAIVNTVAYIEANNISLSMASGAAYNPAPLPTFASFNTGTVAAYTSYTTPSFSFSTYGELTSTVETVYVYESAPSGESALLGVIALGQQVYYVTTTEEVGRMSYWTMSVFDWYDLASLARIAGTSSSIAADSLTAAYPEINWPEWDPTAPGWQHAADSRAWPILGIMLAYEAIKHSADQVYFSPTRMRIIIGTYDPYLGFIGQIFTTGTVPIVGDLMPGSILSPGSLEFDRPMTILFLGSTKGKIEQMRISGCYSVRVIPIPTEYNPIYDPPSALNPTGIGRCLINDNN